MMISSSQWQSVAHLVTAMTQYNVNELIKKCHAVTKFFVVLPQSKKVWEWCILIGCKYRKDWFFPAVDFLALHALTAYQIQDTINEWVRLLQNMLMSWWDDQLISVRCGWACVKHAGLWGPRISVQLELIQFKNTLLIPDGKFKYCSSHHDLNLYKYSL